MNSFLPRISHIWVFPYPRLSILWKLFKIRTPLVHGVATDACKEKLDSTLTLRASSLIYCYVPRRPISVCQYLPPRWPRTFSESILSAVSFRRARSRTRLCTPLLFGSFFPHIFCARSILFLLSLCTSLPTPGALFPLPSACCRSTSFADHWDAPRAEPSENYLAHSLICHTSGCPYSLFPGSFCESLLTSYNCWLRSVWFQHFYVNLSAPFSLSRDPKDPGTR